MTNKGLSLSFFILFAIAPIAASAQDAGKIDGEGIDSQLLWPTPGPSNFATVLSSDIVGNKSVTFSGMFGYYAKPLGVKNIETGKKQWIVDNAFTADFMWAFGIIDVFQLGLVLPVVLDQDGVGATPFQPQGAPKADYALASSALRDMRFNIKTRFLGGGATIPISETLVWPSIWAYRFQQETNSILQETRGWFFSLRPSPIFTGACSPQP